MAGRFQIKVNEIKDGFEQIGESASKASSLVKNHLVDSLRKVQPINLPVIFKTSSESNVQEQLKDVELFVSSVKKVEEQFSDITIGNQISEFSNQFKVIKEKINEVGSIAVEAKNSLEGTKGLSDSFTTVNKELEKMAQVDNSIEAVSEKIERTKSTLDDIKNYAKSLKETTDSIRPKEQTYSTHADTTLFSYFNDFLDSITKDLDPAKLQNFKNVAESLRSFSMALKEIVSVNKTFDKVRDFFKNLNTPSEGETVAPLRQFIETINTYVNEIGGVSRRSISLSENEDGLLEVKSVVNSKVEGIKDVYATIRILTDRLTSLSGVEGEKPFEVLKQAGETIKKFVNELGSFMRVSKEVTDSEGNTRTVEVLDEHVVGVRDVLKSIALLSTDLEKMAGENIKTGLQNVGSAQEALNSFIFELGSLGKRREKTIVDSEGNEKTIEVLDVYVQGTRDILKSIDILSTDLNNMAKKQISTGLEHVGEAEGVLHSFILKLGNFMRGEKEVTDSEGNTRTVEVLNDYVQGSRDVIKTIDFLSSSLTKMANEDIKKGIDAVESANTSLYNFIEDLGKLGTRNQEGVSVFTEGDSVWTLKSTVENKLNDKVQGVRDIIKTIDILSSDLIKMSDMSINTGIANIDKANESLQNFINKLSAVGLRDSVSNSVSSDTGLLNFAGNPITQTETKIESVLNVKIQSVRDILSTVNTLATNLTKLATEDVKYGITAVDSANTALYNFIDQLGSLGERSSGQTVLEPTGEGDFVLKFKRNLNSKVEGVQDILNLVSSLSTRLQKMADQNIPTGIENVDKANKALQRFINELGGLGMRKEGGDSGSTGGSNWNPFADELKTVLNDKIQGTKDVLDMIKTLGTNLEKLAGVGTGIYNVDKARESVYKFIADLGSLGQRPEGIGKEAEDGTKNIKEQLNRRVEGVQDILDVLHVLTKNLNDLGGSAIADGLAALELARPALQQFIAGFDIFTDKPQSSTIGFSDPNKETVGQKLVPIIQSQVQGLQAVVEAMKPLPGIVAGLNVNEEGRKNIQAVGESIASFIKEFSFVRETIYKGTNYSGRSYEAWPKQSIEYFENGLHNVQVITEVFKKLASALQVLAANAVQGANGLKNSRQPIQEFIQNFEGWWTKPHNVGSNKTPLLVNAEEGIKHIELVSNALAKYAGVLKSMTKFGDVDFTKIGTDFSQFVTALNTIVGSDALSKINPEDAEKLGVVGRALKGMSSFVNSMLKGGDFSGFTTNVTQAIPAITTFINEMSRLSTLSTFPDFERVARAVGSFNGRLHDATKTVERSSRAMTKFRAIMRQIYTAFVGGAVVYSIVRGIKSAIKEMYNLEYAMARVNTIARVSNETLKDMTHFVQDMSSQYGVASGKVSKALYDINSATIKGAASMKILEQSLSLAVAGFTEVEKVTDLIAKAVNAYQYNVSEAAKISDILFVTVERGINPMEELSEYMGRLFTVAANAGVSLEEVGAGLATLTARGYQTNIASTALNSAILKLSTGTKELNKLFQQYGYASSSSALRTIGLAGALQILNKATKGSTEKLHDLGFNYRDIRAATTLASGAISEYNKTLAMMNDESYTANKTSEAVAKVQDTVKYKFDQLKATYTVFIQTISEYMDKNETIKSFLSGLSKIIQNVTESMRGANLTIKQQFGVSLTTLLPKIVATYGIFKLLVPLFKSLSPLGTVLKLSFFRIGAGAEVATANTKAFNAALISLKTTIMSLAKAFVIFGSIQSVFNLVGAVKKINEAGTFSSGWKEYWGSEKEDSAELTAKVMGIAGNFVDFFTGNLLSETGLGSLLREKYKKSDYKDLAAIRETALYQGNYATSEFGKAVARQISDIRKFDILGEGLNEDKILKVYNEAIDSIQKEARSRKVSKEQLESALKVASESRDIVLSYNDAMKKLLPNTMALNDVFAQASKNIEESVEKFKSPMEKQIQGIMEAQNAISKIAEMTGWTEEQIKAGGSSVAGMNQLKELWDEQASNIIENISSFVQPNLDKILNPSYYENELALKEQRLQEQYENLRSLAEKEYFDKVIPSVKHTSEESPLRRASSLDAKGMLEEVRSFVDSFGAVISDELKDASYKFQIKIQDYTKFQGISDFEKYSLGVDDFLYGISKAFTPEQFRYIQSHKEDFINAFITIPDELKNDPRAIANKFREIFINPEFAKNLDVLGRTYLQSIQDSDKFRKSISKLGVDLAKFSKELSPEGIIGNKFNLQSVREIKERLKNTVYDPKTIMGADLSVIDQYATIAMKGIMEHNPVNVIIDSLVTEFKNNDALKDVDIQDLQNRAIAFIAAIQQIGAYTEEAFKQLSEVDYTKVMRRMQFGSDMSHFKAYKAIGKDLISNLLGIDIYGSSFGTLLRDFESDKSKVGFNAARENFIAKFGEAGESAWTTFAFLFKYLASYEQQFISPLQTEYRNSKKRIYTFMKNYEDAFLTPIQRLNKLENKLKAQVSKLKSQAKEGTIDSDLVSKIVDNMEQIQKLNEESMTMKVPSAITASEAVKTGSKEAFDLVASNIFRDMYKVNQEQLKQQEELVQLGKTVNGVISKAVSNLNPIGIVAPH